MHIKAITKVDVWTHLSRLAQLVNTPCTRLDPAGPHLRRATSLCSWLRPCCIMNSESSFTAIDAVAPAEGVVVFRCTKCNNIEMDTKKLKWKVNIGAAILLCCAICPEWHTVETEIQPITDLGAPPPIVASPPAKASFLSLISQLL